VVSTVAVIYNSFNISVIERISQFGLLRSVGATPKQIRRIVLKEAAILSVISIPIGLVSGVFAMKIVFYIIGLIQSEADLLNEMEITFSSSVFLISTIIGLITVFLSAIGPARQAARVSPLEAVRNTKDIKKESIKKVRGSRLIRKVLGVEGEIAHKNLRRNRKRFIITVFSMVISIILFITFSTFSDFTFEIGAIDSSRSSDFEIYGNLGDRADDIYTSLMDMEDVERVYRIQESGGSSLIDRKKINEKLIDMNPHMLDGDKGDIIDVYNSSLAMIGDENLEVLNKHLKSGKIDIDKMNKENGVLVINKTYSYKGMTDVRVLLEGFNLKVGDKVPFASYDHDVIDEDTKYTD
ncbi:MAG TPA: FtsX-like permease family protein, partial [Tissierellaceae bacterium]|nr:FtsX-like permease family protein [Tissierellaceae bacterium]